MSSQKSGRESPVWGNAKEITDDNDADKFPSSDGEYDSAAAALALLKSKGVRKENSTDLSFLTDLLISVSDVDLRKDRFSISVAIDRVAQIQAVAILLKRATNLQIAQSQEEAARRAQEEEEKWNVSLWDTEETESARKHTGVRQDRNHRRQNQFRSHPYQGPSNGRVYNTGKRSHEANETSLPLSNSRPPYSSSRPGTRHDEWSRDNRNRKKSFQDRRVSSRDAEWRWGEKQPVSQRYQRDDETHYNFDDRSRNNEEEDESLYWYLRQNVHEKPGVTAKICGTSSAVPWYSGQFEGELCKVVSYLDCNKNIKKSFAGVTLLKDNKYLEVPAEFLEPARPEKVQDKALLLDKATYSSGFGTVLSFQRHAALLEIGDGDDTSVISVDIDNLVLVQ